ncbi:MAG: Glutamine transport system permease protein GlnP [Alphaproteobacteria bacterium MarineAlpha3_Bin5]|nr:amino acid ABC transporter permease [Magnetovibrio sp.]PPR77682.1 MAG: Glutamine transport system permease protein GlnP [Alphaproteobacteria bacterium MarineAlpha3_Bin5]
MFDVFLSNLPYLLKGAVQTIWLALAGVGVGTALGLFLGIISAMSGGLIAGSITVYVFTVRGIPVLVWMFLSYYMLPQLGVVIGDSYAVIGALILYTGAFVTEIARGAVLSIPKQQIDAAKGLGMQKYGMLRLVILPQAITMSVPPLLNNSVMMVKATAYVSVVGVWELTYAAREVVERTLAAFQIFLGVMLIYFLICYPLSIFARRLERRYSYEH